MQAYQKIGGGFEPRALRDVVTKADGSRAVVRMLQRNASVAAEFGVYFVDTKAPAGQVWTGQVVADEDGKPVPIFADAPELPFSVLQTEALDRINAEYQARTAVLAAGYPEDEQKSWPVQIREADIVLGADDQPTPWIDAAASARGITRAALAALIQAQDAAYRQYHGQLTGIRQSLRDQVLAVPDDENAPAAFAAIQWPEA